MADSLEAETELYHFLKVACPKWSQARRGCQSDISKVVEKLRSIGVTNARTLVKRIDDGNTINEELAARGHPPLGREAFENIKKQSPFIRSLEFMDIPQVRQVGAFASVPQMLSGGRVAKGMRPLSGSGTLAKSRSGATCDGSSSAHEAISVASAEFPSALQGSEEQSNNVMETYGIDPSLYGGTGARLALSLREPGVPNKLRRRPVTSEINLNSPSAFSIKTLPPRPMSMGSLTTGHERNNSSASSATGSAGNPGQLGEDGEQSSTLRRLRAPTFGGSGIEVERSSSKPDASRKVGRTATAGTLFELSFNPDEADLAHGFRSFRRVGKEMRKQDIPAHWLCAHNLTPQQQGEEMLQEQFVMDERGRFERLIRPSSGFSDMRSHVAKKIRCRLRQEREHDSTSVLNIQHKCMNIRKNIASLANLRRDLSGLRVRVQALGSEEPVEQDVKRDVGENKKRASVA
jgi:hypothetical protein